MGRAPTPVAPTGPRPTPKKKIPKPTGTTPATPQRSTPQRSTPSSTRTGTTTKSSKSVNRNSASSLQKRAEKKQAERELKTGERYLTQASNLNPQARALIEALDELKKRRRGDIRDIIDTRDSQIEQLMASAEALGQGYAQSGVDNEMAAAGSLEGGYANMVRERQDALTQLLTQGAGESDMMKTMLMAARNQQANAAEANRSFYDTLTSINAGITNLNEDTQSKLAGAWITAEGEREQIWRDYMDSRNDAMVQLGQIRTAQADAYANAKEYGATIPRLGAGKKKKKKKVKPGDVKSEGKGFLKPARASSAQSSLAVAAKEEEPETPEVRGSLKNGLQKGKKKSKAPRMDDVRKRQAKKAFNQWADDQSVSYKQKDQPDEIKNYRGMDALRGQQSNTNLAAAMSLGPMPKAEGAGLRKWV
jgi:hypothetical protein